MKKLKKVLKKKQLKVFKDMYYIDELTIYPFISGNRPTAKSLKIIGQKKEKVYIYTVDDFERDEEGDFTYNGNKMVVRRDSIPSEVVAVLDAAISARSKSEE